MKKKEEKVEMILIEQCNFVFAAHIMMIGIGTGKEIAIGREKDQIGRDLIESESTGSETENERTASVLTAIARGTGTEKERAGVTPTGDVTQTGRERPLRIVTANEANEVLEETETVRRCFTWVLCVSFTSATVPSQNKTILYEFLRFF